ncbi:unannotated protein [freshwater metagenome]|uniref:Unannotated protein n=1 Tax=freshwater metagenome TaxID=449393 RepID=A0A6J5YNY4_9ZZZZ
MILNDVLEGVGRAVGLIVKFVGSATANEPNGSAPEVWVAGMFVPFACTAVGVEVTKPTE